MSAKKREATFEEDMERLKALVERLENGQMPLEETFSAYEEGSALVKKLEGYLTAGEKRILELTANGGTSDISEDVAETKEG